MLTLIIVLIALAVIVVVTTGFVVTRHRRVEPPPIDGVVEAPPRVVVPPPEVEAPPEEPEAAVEAPPGEVEAAPPAEVADAEPAPVVVEPEPEPAVLEPEVELAPRFRDRLGRARSLLSGYLTSVRSRGRIDASTWDDLEEALILADVGAPLTAKLLDDLRARVKSDGIDTPDALIDALRAELVSILEGDPALHLAPEGMTVWLFVGVNGVGKTTTIGKLGMRQTRAGHRVVMAAGDTFRAAAADQLELWADRVGASIIRGNEGGDPGAVVFDAVQHAAAREADLVLADTAGRLHTKTNLMEELKKVRRVAERPPGQVTEVLLVVDATTGQNGLVQAQQFASAVGVTGVVITKLDGTAKGGIALAIRDELGIPIKLVGLGEGVEDLVDFDAAEFVDALLPDAPD
jgi:fused signal recognition particle receptor